MTIKKFFTDIRWWGATIIFLAVIGAGIAGWTDLPKKVCKNEQNIATVKEENQTLENTFQKYLAVQSAKEKAEKEKEEMMMEFFKSLKK